MDKRSIGFLTHEHLTELGIAALGDRVGIINHFRSGEKEKRVERLRAILNDRRERKKSASKAKSHGSAKSSRAPTQKTEKLRFVCGWKHWNDDLERYVQKKTAQGGGSREVDINRDATAGDCINICKSFFFHGGVSPEGDESMMTFELGNYHGQPISDLAGSDGVPIKFTAENYKTSTGLARPRIYIHTRQLDDCG